MSRRLLREDGFTLIELQVSIIIMLVIGFAALGVLDAFSSGVASTNRLTDAQDAARRDINRIVGVLRQAGAPAPVTGAPPATVIQALDNDIVLRSTAWPGESTTGSATTHIVRLCLDTTNKTVWFDGLHAGTAGPATPGSACPSTASGWTHRPMATKVLNSAAQPLFRYSSTNPVRSVGLTLRVEGGTNSTSRPIVLQSGSAMRGALAPQVTAADLTKTSCESGQALLTLNIGGAGSSTEGAKLSAVNTDGSAGIPVGPGQILVKAISTPAQIAVTVTNVLGLQTLLTKQVSCP